MDYVEYEAYIKHHNLRKKYNRLFKKFNKLMISGGGNAPSAQNRNEENDTYSGTTYLDEVRKKKALEEKNRKALEEKNATHPEMRHKDHQDKKSTNKSKLW